MPKVIQVIESIETEGAGTPDNPYRGVTRYYTTDGEFIAENDPFEKFDEKVEDEWKLKRASATGLHTGR